MITTVTTYSQPGSCFLHTVGRITTSSEVGSPFDKTVIPFHERGEVVDPPQTQ